MYKSKSFKKNYINSITKSITLTKTHGFDNVSFSTVQLSGESITIRLTLIVKFFLGQGNFPGT